MLNVKSIKFYQAVNINNKPESSIQPDKFMVREGEKPIISFSKTDGGLLLETPSEIIFVSYANIAYIIMSKPIAVEQKAELKKAK